MLDEFDTLSDTTPQLAKMNPSCKYSIVDFYKDGGVPRLMENLQSMLETDVMTVTAHTLAENIRDHKYLYPATGLVNHTLDDPFGYTGGVAVLRGNLAPDTGITKPGAFDKSLHHSRARPSASTLRRPPRRPFWPVRSMTVMWWSSATRVPRAAPVCAKCTRL